MWGRELKLVAALGALELLVDLRHDAAAANLVDIVVGGQPRQGLAVDSAVDIDGHVVASCCGAVDLDQLCMLASDGVDLLSDLVVGRLRIRKLDLHTFVARNGDDRTNLDHGVERQRA